jgi:hypothetical protein
MLEKRAESLPPPPLPQHIGRSESRVHVASRKESLNGRAERPSARPRQRQLAPKVSKVY